MIGDYVFLTFNVLLLLAGVVRSGLLHHHKPQRRGSALIDGELPRWLTVCRTCGRIAIESSSGTKRDYPQIMRIT